MPSSQPAIRHKKISKEVFLYVWDKLIKIVDKMLEWTTSFFFSIFRGLQLHGPPKLGR